MDDDFWFSRNAWNTQTHHRPCQWGKSRSTRGLPQENIRKIEIDLTWISIVLLFNHMVEYNENIDQVFMALADKTRRDILRRTLTSRHTISSLASSYDMSFAAVAKHVHILHTAGLVTKIRVGREQAIEADLVTLERTRKLLESYEKLWMERLWNLDTLLSHLP